MSDTKKIKLAHIKGDLSLQGREKLHPELIKEYAETVDELPPIDLYVESTNDGDVFYIGNGWHRFLAHERAGRTEIKANVHLGGREAALLHACRANTPAEHGRTRSNEDKHKAIKLYMTHADWYKHGNNRIGEACRVDPKTVQEIRLKLQALKIIPEITEREGKDGKTQSATKKRLSISTPEESSQRVMGTFDQAEARAQVGKSIPEKEASSSFASSLEEKKQEDPPSTPPQNPSQQEVSKTEVKASEESEEEGSYQHHNTPSWVRDLFEPMGGIALDPCSNQWSIMQARKAFTAEDDGLAQDWLEASEGGLIFVNPPYKKIGPWVAKIKQEAKRGAEMTLLVPTSHGTQWWQEAARSCSMMGLFNSRVAFTKEGKKNGTPQWETVLFYWGDRPEVFCRALEHVAFLVREIPRQVYRGIYAKDDPRQAELPVLAKQQTAPVETPKEEVITAEDCAALAAIGPEKALTLLNETIKEDGGDKVVTAEAFAPVFDALTAPITQESAEPTAAPVEVPAVQNVPNKEARTPAKWSPTRYLCFHCGEIFDLLGALAAHNKKAHGETIGSVCDVIYGEKKWAALTGNYRFEIIKKRLGIPAAHNQITVNGVTFIPGEKVFVTGMQSTVTSAEIQEAPTPIEEEKSPKKKRGQKEAIVLCLSCQNEAPLATSRDLNGHRICASCFAKFPPSLMVTIKASIKEGHGDEIQRFGQTLTRTARTCEVTPTEATSLSADRRLCIELDEMIRKPGSPLYETPDYFVALLRDAKDEDAIKNAKELADAYLPTDVAQLHAETIRTAASDRREQLQKKEAKVSAPKKARAR